MRRLPARSLQPAVPTRVPARPLAFATALAVVLVFGFALPGCSEDSGTEANPPRDEGADISDTPQPADDRYQPSAAEITLFRHVQALAAARSTDPNALIATRAALRARSAEFAPLLVEWLADDPFLTAAIWRALYEPTPEIIDLALAATAGVDAPELIEPLLRFALSISNPNARAVHQAIQVLGRKGAAALPTLMHLLVSEPQTTSNANRLVRAMPSEDVVTFFASRLADEDPRVREIARQWFVSVYDRGRRTHVEAVAAALPGLNPPVDPRTMVVVPERDNVYLSAQSLLIEQLMHSRINAADDAWYVDLVGRAIHSLVQPNLHVELLTRAFAERRRRGLVTRLERWHGLHPHTHPIATQFGHAVISTIIEQSWISLGRWQEDAIKPDVVLEPGVGTEIPYGPDEDATFVTSPVTGNSFRAGRMDLSVDPPRWVGLPGGQDVARLTWLAELGTYESLIAPGAIAVAGPEASTLFRVTPVIAALEAVKRADAVRALRTALGSVRVDGQAYPANWRLAVGIPLALGTLGALPGAIAAEQPDGGAAGSLVASSLAAVAGDAHPYAAYGVGFVELATAVGTGLAFLQQPQDGPGIASFDARDLERHIDRRLAATHALRVANPQLATPTAIDSRAPDLTHPWIAQVLTPRVESAWRGVVGIAPRIADGAFWETDAPLATLASRAPGDQPALRPASLMLVDALARITAADATDTPEDDGSPSLRRALFELASMRTQPEAAVAGTSADAAWGVVSAVNWRAQPWVVDVLSQRLAGNPPQTSPERGVISASWADILGSVDDPRRVDLLLVMLAEGGPQVQLRVLARLPVNDTTRARLVSAFEGDDPDRRTAAAQALLGIEGPIGDAAINHLLATRPAALIGSLHQIAPAHIANVLARVLTIEELRDDGIAAVLALSAREGLPDPLAGRGLLTPGPFITGPERRIAPTQPTTSHATEIAESLVRLLRDPSPALVAALAPDPADVGEPRPNPASGEEPSEGEPGESTPGDRPAQVDLVPLDLPLAQLIRLIAGFNLDIARPALHAILTGDSPIADTPAALRLARAAALEPLHDWGDVRDVPTLLAMMLAVEDAALERRALKFFQHRQQLLPESRATPIVTRYLERKDEQGLWAEAVIALLVLQPRDQPADTERVPADSRIVRAVTDGYFAGVLRPLGAGVARYLEQNLDARTARVFVDAMIDEQYEVTGYVIKQAGVAYALFPETRDRLVELWPNASWTQRQRILQLQVGFAGAAYDVTWIERLIESEWAGLEGAPSYVAETPERMPMEAAYAIAVLAQLAGFPTGDLDAAGVFLRDQNLVERADWVAWLAPRKRSLAEQGELAYRHRINSAREIRGMEPIYENLAPLGTRPAPDAPDAGTSTGDATEGGSPSSS